MKINMAFSGKDITPLRQILPSEDTFPCFRYGDRCPQSVGGRLFAVFWILVGICVCSVFTASLTTSLTTLSLETKISLPGARVNY